LLEAQYARQNVQYKVYSEYSIYTMSITTYDAQILQLLTNA